MLFRLKFSSYSLNYRQFFLATDAITRLFLLWSLWSRWGLASCKFVSQSEIFPDLEKGKEPLILVRKHPGNSCLTWLRAKVNASGFTCSFNNRLPSFRVVPLSPLDGVVRNSFFIRSPSSVYGSCSCRCIWAGTEVNFKEIRLVSGRDNIGFDHGSPPFSRREIFTLSHLAYLIVRYMRTCFGNSGCKWKVGRREQSVERRGLTEKIEF